MAILKNIYLGNMVWVTWKNNCCKNQHRCMRRLEVVLRSRCCLEKSKKFLYSMKLWFIFLGNKFWKRENLLNGYYSKPGKQSPNDFAECLLSTWAFAWKMKFESIMMIRQERENTNLYIVFYHFDLLLTDRAGPHHSLRLKVKVLTVRFRYRI